MQQMVHRAGPPMTEVKGQVPFGGSWCEDCQVQTGGPVSGERHRDQYPDHEVLLRLNGIRWARY